MFRFGDVLKHTPEYAQRYKSLPGIPDRRYMAIATTDDETLWTVCLTAMDGAQWPGKVGYWNKDSRKWLMATDG